MISVDDALKRILEQLRILNPEKRKILDCIGQVLADDVYAPFDIPRNDNSAMDGYALKASDIKNANIEHPVIFKLVGEVAAGDYPKIKVNSKECVSIMTGGVIPEGADVVVPLEETSLITINDGIKGISVAKYMEIGSNVRKTGEDICNRSLIISKGKIIGPAEISILAAIGKIEINVIRRPIVAILATGSELVNVGDKLAQGKLYNSNSYAIASQVIKFGGIPKILGIAKDNLNYLEKRFSKLKGFDLLVTTGGVSVGEYDFIKNVLRSKGEIDFWQVRMKPGKPVTFGILRGRSKIPHIGLPGNPASCMIAFEIFGRPAIYKMMGRHDLASKTIRAIMEDEIQNTDGRRVFARVTVEKKNNQFYARLSGLQGSAIYSSMLKADGLAIVHEDYSVIKKGNLIEVLLLD